MKKISVLAVFVLIAVCLLCACGKSPTVTVSGDAVILTPTSEFGGKTLMDFMESEKENGNLDFTLSGTMVSSINGKANTADFSSCWMLYTDDEELSNSEWGTYEYNGKTFGSAILGADALTVAEGKTYIWVYTDFN